MKKVVIFVFSLMFPVLCFAQTEQKSVLKSDVSYRYKKAVRDGFYKELNNASGLEEGYHGFVDLGYTLIPLTVISLTRTFLSVEVLGSILCQNITLLT